MLKTIFLQFVIILQSDQFKPKSHLKFIEKMHIFRRRTVSFKQNMHQLNIYLVKSFIVSFLYLSTTIRLKVNPRFTASDAQVGVGWGVQRTPQPFGPGPLMDRAQRKKRKRRVRSMRGSQRYPVLGSQVKRCSQRSGHLKTGTEDGNRYETDQNGLIVIKKG